MKQLFFSLLATSLLMASCQNEDKTAKVTNTPDPVIQQQNTEKVLADTVNYTTLEWLDSADQKLSPVKTGSVLEISYRFKNTGTKPLIILSVNPGCGCTLAEKPEAPVMPGAEGIIKAKFDTKGQSIGPKDKSISVTANTSKSNTPSPSIHSLMFHTEVVE